MGYSYTFPILLLSISKQLALISTTDNSSQAVYHLLGYVSHPFKNSFVTSLLFIVPHIIMTSCSYMWMDKCQVL